jgi:ATP-dependent DNA helicase RecG
MQDAKPAGAPTLSAPQKALQKMGLKRDIDLALHLPLRYEDETRVTRLCDARSGDNVVIEGVVRACEVAYRPRRQLLVTLDDGSDSCVLRFFHFYPSQQKALAVGQRVRALGQVSGGMLGWTMMHPACKPASAAMPTALTPVYPTVAGLPQAYLRRVLEAALARADLSETLPSPDEARARCAAQPLRRWPEWPLAQALRFLHHPSPDVSLATLEDHSHPAWERLKAEELLAQQLSQLESRRQRNRLLAPALLTHAGGLRDRLLAALPFKLTQAQHRVAGEIAADLARSAPMNRLLQGDVGSGKTVVAALAAAACIEAGRQCALMAPTEILAEQHFRKLIGWLEPLGPTVAWLSGGMKRKERSAMLQLIADGQAGLVVGTHAVIQDLVRFNKLALVVIDEQHRFGVEQRLALRGKMDAPGQEPHLLMMTATPIPRTLAMTYYADLDVSVIDEMPPGRQPVLTRLLAEHRRAEVLERVRAQLRQGRQVYWVCPLIEESEALDLVNATQTHAALVSALQDPGDGAAPVLVGLLHSRMKPAEKKAVMSLFTGGQMGLLVSTTVIEVGVDVPNASLMVIEHAERFGLSQLHQLRGRVGRGTQASACVLLYSTGDGTRLGEAARERLKAMVQTSDGFEIARRDLEIRGPGEFLGARQSGEALLRFADLAVDTHWLDWARALAACLLEHFPALAQRHVARWLGGRAEFLKA